jgi:hypothetical protein
MGSLQKNKMKNPLISQDRFLAKKRWPKKSFLIHNSSLLFLLVASARFSSTFFMGANDIKRVQCSSHVSWFAPITSSTHDHFK